MNVTSATASHTGSSRHRVVIIGAGFGGLFAARALRRAPVDVTVLDRRNHHLFQPLLYQVATGVLSEGDVAPPIRDVLRKQRNARVLLGEVVDIDPGGRHVVLETIGERRPVPYDSLIVAAGAAQSYFGHDEFAVHAPGMKTVDDALELRGRIFGAFEMAELDPECSAIVLLVAGITKFTAGAWVALAIVVAFTVFGLIRRHFEHVADAVALSPDASADGEQEETPSEISNLVLVPLLTLNRATIRALAYAVSLRRPVLAVHVSPTEEEGKRFRDYWTAWGDHVPLEVIASPYRAIVPPMVAYIESLHAQRPELTLTVIVPELAVRHWWQRSLHDDTAPRLRRLLRPLPKVVVTSVPFHVSSPSRHSGAASAKAFGRRRQD